MPHYQITNADLHTIVKVSPKGLKVGDTVKVPKELTQASWAVPVDQQGVKIPPGTYKVTSKKRFTGGSIEITSA
jgi:hypothetical protein